MGLNVSSKPNKSFTTNTCPSHPLPAPIPIIGIDIEVAISAAKSAGIFSSTIASPDQIVHAVAFLAMDSSAYISGETIVVDGGFSTQRKT